MDRVLALPPPGLPINAGWLGAIRIRYRAPGVCGDSWKIVARSSPERGGELHQIKSKVGGGAARPGSAAAPPSLGNSFKEVHWGLVGTYGSL